MTGPAGPEIGLNSRQTASIVDSRQVERNQRRVLTGEGASSVCTGARSVCNGEFKFSSAGVTVQFVVAGSGSGRRAGADRGAPDPVKLEAIDIVDTARNEEGGLAFDNVVEARSGPLLSDLKWLLRKVRRLSSTR
jgi:hypothetical protein